LRQVRTRFSSLRIPSMAEGTVPLKQCGARPQQG
jgi:hypothetical protein